MDVGILYSGGKDSTYAIEYCKSKNWNIKYLISVKPTRTDCYLFHFATVELTQELSKILGYKHFYLTCNVADPKKEANIVKELVEKQQNIDKIDALVLGGIGLQETQLRSLQKALMPLKVEVFASHAGQDHEELFRDMINKGYEIIISQVASDGLIKWLGKTITKNNFEDLKKDSIKYGFHLGFEGGFADSIVLSAPIFGNKKIILDKIEKIVENKYCGHIIIKDYRLVEEPLESHIYNNQLS